MADLSNGAAEVPQPAKLQLTIATQHNTSTSTYARMLDIAVAAFAGDDAFGWRFPKRNEFPQYNRAIFAKYLGMDMLNPEVWVIVANVIDGTGRVVPVGYGTWARKGKGAEKVAEGRDCW